MSYSLFKVFYKKIEKVANPKKNNEIQVSNIKKNGNFEYQIYTINKGRLYTDRVNDTAVISKNEIVENGNEAWPITRISIYKSLSNSISAL